MFNHVTLENGLFCVEEIMKIAIILPCSFRPTAHGLDCGPIDVDHRSTSFVPTFSTQPGPTNPLMLAWKNSMLDEMTTEDSLCSSRS